MVIATAAVTTPSRVEAAAVATLPALVILEVAGMVIATAAVTTPSRVEAAAVATPTALVTVATRLL